MDGLHGGAGCDPKLLSEQEPEPLVGAERLGDVASPLECLHEDAVPGLAVGRKLGQRPGPFLGLGQCRAAKAKAGGGEALQTTQSDLLQPASPLGRSRAPPAR